MLLFGVLVLGIALGGPGPADVEPQPGESAARVEAVVSHVPPEVVVVLAIGKHLEDRRNPALELLGEVERRGEPHGVGHDQAEVLDAGSRDPHGQRYPGLDLERARVLREERGASNRKRCQSAAEDGLEELTPVGHGGEDRLGWPC